MTDIVPAVSAVPIDRNPAAVYLAGLAGDGRRTMRSKLNRAAAALHWPEALSAPWWQLRYQHVAALRTKLREDGLAPSTINTTLAAVRGVAEAACNLDLMPADDLQRIRSVKPVRGSKVTPGRALTSSEVGALMDACLADDGPAGARDAAMIALMYCAGLRRAEVVAIRSEDVSIERREILVHGKGARERMAYIPDAAADAVAAWMGVRGDDDGPLFVPIDRHGHLRYTTLHGSSVYRVLSRRATEAGILDVSPHDMRRTFISELLTSGVDVLTVQGLAGHASPDTTALYDRRGERAKRKAVAMLHVPFDGERRKGVRSRAKTQKRSGPSTRDDLGC